MATVPIHLPAPAPISYDVRIEPGVLQDLGAIVRAVAPAPSCIIISDSAVAPLYLRDARASLEAAHYRVIDYVFPAGEESKTLNTAVAALDHVLRATVERATPVVALGGGVVGDLAGFVAATLLRGVPFIQVPTTLLAAVDASVGGKVGVDHAVGKNLIGAFHQPRAVVTDVSTFKTLPTREIRCGLAECIKHGIIRDRQLFSFIATNAAKITACDAECLTELVAWNVKIKGAVVMEDPFEKGVRALLNLGHTFGHAIEAVAGYSGIQHGEAVALGTIAASRLAARMGKISDADAATITNLFDFIGLPASLPSVKVNDVYAAMFTDKKVSGGKLRLVLPTSIGTADVFRDVPENLIRDAIASLELPGQATQICT